MEFSGVLSISSVKVDTLNTIKKWHVFISTVSIPKAWSKFPKCISYGNVLNFEPPDKPFRMERFAVLDFSGGIHVRAEVSVKFLVCSISGNIRTF